MVATKGVSLHRVELFLPQPRRLGARGSQDAIIDSATGDPIAAPPGLPAIQLQILGSTVQRHRPALASGKVHQIPQLTGKGNMNLVSPPDC